MILNLEESDVFLVKCSDWKVAVATDNHDEAATLALEYMLNLMGKNLKLSCVIVTTSMSIYADFEDDEEDTIFHATSKILANCGRHELSKNLKDVFGT